MYIIQIINIVFSLSTEKCLELHMPIYSRFMYYIIKPYNIITRNNRNSTDERWGLKVRIRVSHTKHSDFILEIMR